MYGFCYDRNLAPPELRIGLDWLRWGVPYIPGGLRDQPLLLFSRMKRAVRVYEAITAWQTKYTPTPALEKIWYEMHKGDMQIMHYLWNSFLLSEQNA